MSSPARPIFARVPVGVFIQKGPQVCITVVDNNDAILIREAKDQILGHRTILRIDHKRSIVLYSKTVSDWNTVASVVRVRVSHDVLPIVDCAPPKTLKKKAQYWSMILLGGGLTTIIGVVVYKAFFYAVTFLVGLFFGATPGQLGMYARGWLQAQISAKVVGVVVKVYWGSAGYLSRQTQVILKAVIIWLETSNDNVVVTESQKVAVQSEL